jgi:hypothetical protein
MAGSVAGGVGEGELSGVGESDGDTVGAGVSVGPAVSGPVLRVHPVVTSIVNAIAVRPAAILAVLVIGNLTLAISHAALPSSVPGHGGSG